MLTTEEQTIIDKFEKYIYEKSPSNEVLVQIIALAGDYLNLQTIPDYSKSHGISYNGVKNNRHVIELFGVKLVIDNN